MKSFIALALLAMFAVSVIVPVTASAQALIQVAEKEKAPEAPIPPKPTSSGC